MTTFVCLHGAGGRASYWNLVGEELRAEGHEVVAVDLPCDQEVGLGAYVDTTIAAIGHRQDVVLLAQSLAGLIAPLVCDRVRVSHIVLLTAMVPRPGETGAEWWVNVGHADAVAAQDLPDMSEETLFTHDVPADVLVRAGEPREQSGELFEEPWPRDAWPGVPTTFLLCRDDRFFPAAWMRELVRNRLGIEPVEIPGGHCAFLSQPKAVARAAMAALHTVPEKT